MFPSPLTDFDRLTTVKVDEGPCHENDCKFPHLNVQQSKDIEKRKRNNLAVRKWREKQRIKMMSVKWHIQRLKFEQRQLMKEIEQSKTRFEILRDLYFQAQSSLMARNESQIDVKTFVAYEE